MVVTASLTASGLQRRHPRPADVHPAVVRLAPLPPAPITNRGVWILKPPGSRFTFQPECLVQAPDIDRRIINCERRATDETFLTSNLGLPSPTHTLVLAMASRLVLVIGDLFIPDRAPDIPAKVKSRP